MTLKKILTVFFLFSAIVFADVSKGYPAFNFTDWPKDIVNSLYKQIPELQNKNFSEAELNGLLKKINLYFPFENLKIIEKNNQLYLIGDPTTKISVINFSGANNISTDELIAASGLTLLDAENLNKIRASEDKILSYLNNLGYRNAKIKNQYVNATSIQRYLNFTLDLGLRTVISTVQIIGLDPESQKDIERSLYWNSSGEILTDDKLKTLSQMLRTLLSQKGYFLTLVTSPQIFFNASDTAARIVFKLQQQPRYSVEITGAKNFSPLFLNTEVLNLNNYFSTESNFGSELSEKLRSYYLEKGFSRFEITYYERKENNLIIITLNMDEGPKIFIEHVGLSGLYSRSESFYVDRFFKLSSQKIQDRLWFRPDAEQGAKNLITSMQNEGFISAKLNRLDSLANIKKINSVDVNLAIEEGPQTQIESIEFKNNISFPKELLIEKMGFNQKTALNLNDFEQALVKLKTFYADNGFMEMSVANEKQNIIVYNLDTTKAQIIIDIAEGVQISVGTIILDGNKLTHDKLILSELEFKPGDVLTPQKIQESISRLQKVGHFASIEISTLEPNSNVKERSVVVKLSERKPMLFTFGIGATNENERTFHAYSGWAHRNIGGWGRGFSVRGDLNYNDVFFKFKEYKFTVGFLEPYLLDTRTRFRINYTTQASVSDTVLRKQTIANSAVWTVEQDFTSHVTGIWDIYNITNYVEKGITTDDEIKYGYSGQDFEIAFTGPTLDIDYRDNVLNPQKGHFSRFSIEYANEFLGSHKVDDFVRATGQSTLYLPFFEQQLIWANSLRGGYVAPTSSEGFGVPYDKKGFILGGRTTLRGFESNEFFPTSDPKNTENLGTNYHFTTPVSYQLIKSELRFPLSTKHGISGAFFYDGGQVLIGGIQFKDSYRDSVGIGFRYATPVGPLNLEYAHKLDRKPSESEGAFHLSVGVF